MPSPLVGPGVDARVFGQAAAEGAKLANFCFSDYLTDPDAVKSTVDRLTMHAEIRPEPGR